MPRIDATWRIGKKQLVIPTLGYNKRINIFVTILWPLKRIVWNTFKRRRNTEFRKHLSNVIAYAKRYRLKRVILFIDQASYHKTPEVKKFVREHKDMLRVKFLGKKNPNSNPTECLVNKRINSSVCVNRCHNSLDDLRNSTKEFLRKYNLFMGLSLVSQTNMSILFFDGECITKVVDFEQYPFVLSQK